MDGALAGRKAEVDVATRQLSRDASTIVRVHAEGGGGKSAFPRAVLDHAPGGIAAAHLMSCSG